MSKVLLLLGSGLGNIVQCTPCITALKSLGHDVSVAMWSSMPKAKELLEGSPCLDNLFFYPEDKIEGKYDFIVETLHSRTSQFGDALKGKGKVLTTVFSKWGSKNDVEINLEAIEEHFNYDIKQKGIPNTFCETKHLNKNVALINGSNPDPKWLRKRYPRMNELTKSMPDTLFFCFGNEGEGFEDFNVINFCGKLSLSQTMSMMNTCDASVCSDSGLSHVSAALDIPTIVLFGFTDEIKCKPLGNHVKTINSGVPCRPCQYKCGVWKNCTDWKCIKNIEPEKIKEELVKLLLT